MEGSFHNSTEQVFPMTVPVDLVLKHNDLLACMVECPRCGTVNVHGVGHTHSEVWGHRECGKRNAHCVGYILRPASVIQRVLTPEWRRRARTLIRLEKMQIKRRVNGTATPKGKTSA